MDEVEALRYPSVFRGYCCISGHKTSTQGADARICRSGLTETMHTHNFSCTASAMPAAGRCWGNPSLHSLAVSVL
jgi:hypothetical protein